MNKDEFLEQFIAGKIGILCEDLGEKTQVVEWFGATALNWQTISRT